MNKSVSLEDILPIITEILDKGSTITVTATGNSMLPMLVGGVDTITLSSKPDKLKKYSLPLYHRINTNTYAVHRVIKIDSDKLYVMCGDNEFSYEYGIRHEHIVAEVISFTHKGKEISINNYSYKLYCIIWCKSRFIRQITKGIIRRLKYYFKR